MSTTIPTALLAGSATPISAPGAFDVFKLDSIMSGPCKITKCNGRQLTWQEQQAPGLTGAFVVFRGEKLVQITYRFEIYNAELFGKYKVIEAYCNASKIARPVRSMRLTDLRLAGLQIPHVALAKLPHQELVNPGLWAYELDLQEDKRLQLFGGPTAPPRNPTEEAIVKKQDEVNRKHRILGDQVDGATAAQRVGK